MDDDVLEVLKSSLYAAGPGCLSRYRPTRGGIVLEAQASCQVIAELVPQIVVIGEAEVCERGWGVFDEVSEDV